MSKKNTYNQSFWYFKPDAIIPFGMHKGKKVIEVLQTDAKYLNYCLAKFDHFLFSRPTLRYLQAKTSFIFTTDALDYLGQKMDKSDLLMLNKINKTYENYSKTGSIIKSVHAKGINNIMNHKNFFKFIEFQEEEKITEANYEWFSKFFEKVIQDDVSEKTGVKCSMFLINHGFKNVWVKWLNERWRSSNNGADLYTYCINILENGINVSVIVVINTQKSSYSRATTKVRTSYKGAKSETVTILAKNEYLLPTVDFWRHTLTYAENKLNNWVVEFLHSKAKRKYSQEVFVDGKSSTSKVLAYKSFTAFYLEDASFTSLVETYYTEIKRTDFLDRRRKQQEEADYEELLSPASHDDTDHDEDAWDALTDGQYGDWNDRFK